jgi:LuxR family transcriptional regulator, maltose regulon positive regulatory protein
MARSDGDRVGAEVLALARIVHRIIERRKLRRRLLETLDAYPLVAIVAPPVSGKSVLLDQLAADLRAHGDAVADGLAASSATDVALVRVAGEGLDEATARQVEAHIADGGRCVLVSDRPLDTAFPLARLRNQVREFRLADLALRRDELAEFLGGEAGDDKTERDLRALHDRIGGWIGAWNVVKAQAEQGRTLAEIRAGLSGAMPELRGYFEQLILPALDPDVRAFILVVGMLERVSPMLADMLTRRSDGLGLLERAAAQCAFIEVTPDGLWWRPATILRDYVRHRRARDEPQALRADLLRAAEWMVMGEDWLAAVPLFAEADEPARAAEILTRHADDMITGRGEVLSFRQMAAGLSRDLQASRTLAPELALGAIFAGDFADAERLLENLEPAMAGRDVTQRTKLEAIGVSIDFGLERFERVIGRAPRWLDQHADADPRFRAIAAVALYWSCLAQLDISGASRALAGARTDTSKAGARFLEAWLVICDATLKWELGRVSEADTVLTDATASGPIDHTMNLIRLAVAWETGDEPRARQLAAASLRQGARHTVVETAFLGWAAAARVAALDGGPTRALKLLQEAEATMAARHGERARRLIRLFRAKLLLQGPEARAAELGAELEELAADRAGLARGLDEAARLTLARWRVLHGEPRAAISLVQPVVSAALPHGRMRSWGEAALIYAGGLARLDEVDRAVRMAWQAIEQLASVGLGASIWDEHVLLAPLLDDLLTRAGQDGALDGQRQRIFRTLAQRSGRTWVDTRLQDTRDHDPTAAPDLTDTERRMLTLVGQGLSNADLAGRMLVQVSTVKWHLHNTFEKLGVRSRTAALAEARRLGLLG